MSKSQRKIGNFIIDPAGQMRLLAPFLMYLVVTVGMILAITFRFKVSLEDLALIVPTENKLAVEKLDALGTQLFMICLGGVILSGLMCLLSWAITSHRVFGPMIQIKRKIESLRDGDYESDFPVRKYDEFQEVARALDHLTKVLKSARGNKTKVSG